MKRCDPASAKDARERAPRQRPYKFHNWFLFEMTIKQYMNNLQRITFNPEVMGENFVLKVRELQ